ncbi:MAG: hypothetical protein LUQ54_03905 [Methanoregula sp.]|nr:hypothetical protein [Methanoregula sp.]
MKMLYPPDETCAIVYEPSIGLPAMNVSVIVSSLSADRSGNLSGKQLL